MLGLTSARPRPATGGGGKADALLTGLYYPSSSPRWTHDYFMALMSMADQVMGGRETGSGNCGNWHLIQKGGPHFQSLAGIAET
jgi:hypothetical protein